MLAVARTVPGRVPGAILSLAPWRFIHHAASEYNQYYEVLGVAPGSDQGAVRDAFIKLVKKHHPDSGSHAADANKFQQIETAYRKLMQKFSDERHNHSRCAGEYGLYYEQKVKKVMEEVEEDDGDKKRFEIKRSTPQHRQYLSYEGIGFGTPGDRQKQYSKYQVLRASENVIDYKVQKFSSEYPETSLVDKDRQMAKKIRTRYGIERMVDDMIQEAMARGDFDNLPNAGKPLKNLNHNPYVDTVTHKLNEVLINNGYAPEWVMLEKEIRQSRAAIRAALLTARATLGPLPLTQEEEERWAALVGEQHQAITDLNKTIDKYNLLVPVLAKQLVHFPTHREARRALEEGRDKHQVPPQDQRQTQTPPGAAEGTARVSAIRRVLGMFKLG